MSFKGGVIAAWGKVSPLFPQTGWSWAGFLVLVPAAAFGAHWFGSKSVEPLQERLASVEHERDQFSVHATTRTAEIGRLGKEVTKLTGERDQFSRDVVTRTDERDQLGDSVRRLRESDNEMTVRNAGLTSDNAALTQAKADLERELAAAKALLAKPEPSPTLAPDAKGFLVARIPSGKIARYAWVSSDSLEDQIPGSHTYPGVESTPSGRMFVVTPARVITIRQGSLGVIRDGKAWQAFISTDEVRRVLGKLPPRLYLVIFGQESKVEATLVP